MAGILIPFHIRSGPCGMGMGLSSRRTNPSNDSLLIVRVHYATGLASVVEAGWPVAG